MISQGGEDVAEFALLRRRIADTIGRQQREFERAGNFDGSAIARFLLAMKMALQFHVNIALSEICRSGIRPSVELLPCRHAASALASGPSSPPVRQINAGSMFLQFFSADSAFAFLSAQLHFCDQAAKVLIAGAGRNEKGKAEGIADFGF